MNRDNDLTRILGELRGADGQKAVTQLVPYVYDELRALAQSHLRNERNDHTLQTTALVHEAYMRLAERHTINWVDRSHFFCAAAKTMRRVLVNHALGRQTAKRGGGVRNQSLDEHVTPPVSVDPNLVALDEALDKLGEEDRRKVQVVELRYFGGCTIEETADVLGISTATVEREWRFARVWLRSILDSDE